ncbi:MAG: ATP-binding protein [Polyangiaceae bacterium]
MGRLVDFVFYAGVLVTWTTIYVSAALYSVWALRRRQGERGAAQLAALFSMLGTSSACLGLAMLVREFDASVLARSSEALTYPTAVLICHFAIIDGRGAVPRWIAGTWYGASAVLGVLTLVGMTELPPTDPQHLFSPSPVGAAARSLLAIAVLAAAFLVGRTAVQRRGGYLPFFGLCFTSVMAIRDVVAAVLGHHGPPLLHLGFEGFALTLFGGQIVKFSRKRERLVAKTAELSKKSEALESAFRDLRSRQDELVRKEQLAAIGELAAVVAHEVRNPLAIMSNAVSTLKRQHTNEEHRETLLGILSEETVRLNQLVGDLLHYAKPLAVEKQSIVLRELVEKAVNPIRDKGVDISIDEEKGVPRVGGDPLLLRQAIENVVNNALQAMPSGGNLAIELVRARRNPRDSQSGEHGAPGVKIIISDTGEGMDTVVRKRALDPFFTTKPAGTGLGLAIVARVVDAHGGQLTIRSERGAGTEVHMFLPVEPEFNPVRTGSNAAITAPVIEPFNRKKKESA